MKLKLKVSSIVPFAFVRTDQSAEAQEPYKFHFGPNTTLLSEPVRECVDQRKWNMNIVRYGGLRSIYLSTPEHNGAEALVHQVSVSCS